MVAVVNCVLHHQPLPYLVLVHLIEEEVAQTVQNDPAVVELEPLGHMALHTGYDLGSGARNCVEVGALIEERIHAV